MNTSDYGQVISTFEDILNIPQDERSKPYSLVEVLKSQLNVHIYNINPRKKKLFVSFFSNADYTNAFPEKYKDWLLDEVKAQRKPSGKYLCSAYYIRDFTPQEHDEFDQFLRETEATVL